MCIQGLARLFYFATVRKVVVLVAGRGTQPTMENPSKAAASMLADRAFVLRLAFLLRPLLARTALLLDLLRLPPKKLPDALPPPSEPGPLAEVAFMHSYHHKETAG